MSVKPVVRHLIACKKEPTMNGGDPSLHDIMYAVQPKAGFQYPVWLRTFYVFAMVTSGSGVCNFEVEMRLVELDDAAAESETVVGRSLAATADLGGHPLQVHFLSIQMPPVRLPKRGVYRLYLICEGVVIGEETIHGR